jgi:hypothetical protein
MGATLPQTLIFFHLGSGFAVTAIRWQTEARCGDQLDHIVRVFCSASRSARCSRISRARRCHFAICCRKRPRCRSRSASCWRHADDAVSLRCLHAKRDDRSVGGVGLDAAGDLPLIEIRRLASRRPAIGADQQFVAAAASGASSTQAVVTNDAECRTGRSRLALRSRRAGWTHRPGRTGKAGLAPRSRRPGNAWIAFLPLAAAGQRHHDQPDKN